MKRFLFTMLSVALLLGAPVFAETNEVSVSLANDSITINNTVIDNTKEQYPFIVYKDITYFPMTWDLGKAMGLSTAWTQETGLKISKSGGGEAVKLAPNASNDFTKTYKASVATDRIEIGGKSIDNATQDYPLLVFRDITYFPMTYAYMVNEFGTEYSWSEATGLVINALKDEKDMTSGETNEKQDGDDLEASGEDIIDVDIERPEVTVPVDTDGNAIEGSYEANQMVNATTEIGSWTNNPYTDRSENATYQDDLDVIDEMLSPYVDISNSGHIQAQFGNDEDSFDTFAKAKLTKNSKSQPVLEVRDWAWQEYMLGSSDYVMMMNATREILKYYAESDADGEAIYAYLDKAMKVTPTSDLEKVQTFGSTKIILSDPGIFGYDIIFVD